MTPRATRTIGTGDRWDVTDSGIYVPDWADLGHAGRSKLSLFEERG